jgi:hypothetical protein
VFQFDKNGKNTNIAYLLYVGSHDEVYHWCLYLGKLRQNY